MHHEGIAWKSGLWVNNSALEPKTVKVMASGVPVESSCVCCVWCMLGPVPTAKLHQYVINDLGCRETLFTSSKKKKKKRQRRNCQGNRSKNVLFWRMNLFSPVGPDSPILEQYLTLSTRWTLPSRCLCGISMTTSLTTIQHIHPTRPSNTSILHWSTHVAVVGISLSERWWGFRPSLSGFLTELNPTSDPLWGSCVADMSAPVDLWLMLNVSSDLTFS